MNRAAMSSPGLAEILLASERHRIEPLIEQYLANLAARKVLDVTDTEEAFRVLYGLIIQDTQIRALLGEPVPSRAQINAQARLAVDRFLELTWCECQDNS